MSDPAISYRGSASASSPRRRLLLAGLFILLSIGLCNVGARAINMESSRNQLHSWALDPGHGAKRSHCPAMIGLHSAASYDSIAFGCQKIV